MNDHDELREAAVERITNRRDFRAHAATYLAISMLLIVIWAATGAGYFWPIWPIAGWGIGVGMHAWNVFGQRPITEEEIRNETRRHAS